MKLIKQKENKTIVTCLFMSSKGEHLIQFETEMNDRKKFANLINEKYKTYNNIDFKRIVKWQDPFSIKNENDFLEEIGFFK